LASIARASASFKGMAAGLVMPEGDENGIPLSRDAESLICLLSYPTAVDHK